MSKQPTLPEINMVILNIIQDVKPFDKLEARHIKEAVDWISSGAKIFREESPDKHIVCYGVFFDQKEGRILLLEHRKSQLMLPSGGHPEPGEHPWATVKREMLEELAWPAVSINPEGDVPFFVTQVETVGPQTKHTDVDLWYLLEGDETRTLDKGTDFEREFAGYQWLGLREILETDISKMDPHMHRFVRKVQEVFNI